MINVLKHKDLIEIIFKKYNLPTTRYEIVDDVKEWCEENGIQETDPFRPAKCLCNTKNGDFYIVFRKEQTDSMISSVKSNMEIFYGFKDEVAQLDTDLKYLEHLILHEIACKILITTNQMLRDKWAFKEMGINS